MSHLHVLDHVHWDREWYRPHEQFRARLVELVERICDQLESGERPHFHLDGQTVTIADVVEIRPDLEARLQALVTTGRLTVGPWHVLADNQLVSGENLIRNLLTARRWGARIGGLAPDGYSPDAFGHPGDLPRILRGFGIETALVWRGAPPEHARFHWRSPDGSQVLAVNQRYHEAEVLWDDASAPQALAAFIDGERRRAPAGPWLLMNGGDHLAPTNLTERSTAAAAAAAAGVPMTPSTLAGFFDALRRDTDLESLPVVEGELRRPGGRLTFLLPGTLSARTYLKQANVAAQTLLTEWVEPLAQLSGLTGEGSTDGLMRHAWELMLQNAPHDSVCGCSVDAVHRQNMLRAARVVEIGEHLVDRSLQALGLETRPMTAPAVETTELAVLNPQAHPVTQGVDVELVTATGSWPVAVVDARGQAVAFESADLGVAKAFEADLDLLPDSRDVRRHRVSLLARDVPSRGWEVYTVRLSTEEPRPPAPWRRGRAVTLGSVSLEADDDATVTIRDGDRVLTGMGRLVDEGDRGDTYNFDPPMDDAPVAPVLRRASVRSSPLRAQLRLHADLTVPRELTPDRSARSPEALTIPITITITTWQGLPGANWVIELNNTTLDHRLRFHVPTAGAADTWLADSHYSLVERATGPALGLLPTEEGHEATCAVAPVQSFAAIGEGAIRVALLCAGLPEVQGLRADPRHGREAELAVTLLRSVGWLSRFDLATRTAGAGPQLATPEAQCPGPQRFDLGIGWGDTTTDDLELSAAAARHRAPLRAAQIHSRRPSTPAAYTPLQVKGAIVTSYKAADDGDGAVLRLSNPTNTPRTAKITLDPAPLAVHLSTLDERVGTPMTAQVNGELSLAIPAYGLITLRIT